MITTEQMFGIVCDNCKECFCDDSTGFAFYSTKEFVLDQAKEGDWEVVNEKHYCPDCWSHDDDGNVMLQTQTPKP